MTPFRRLDSFFGFTAAGSSFRTEVIAGLSTFAAMAYIICLQPALLSGSMQGMSPTGMPMGALLTSTCLVAAFGSILMGLAANYPLGLAPGVGSSFFFVFSVLPACAAALGAQAGDPAVWHSALGVVLLSGIIFLVISFTRFRVQLISSISASQKSAIAAGLGLFIGMLGLKNGHVILIENNQLALGASLRDPAVIIFGAGLLVSAALQLRRVKGALLLGIAASALIALLLGEIRFGGVVGLPADPGPVLFRADPAPVFHHMLELVPLVLICTFVDLFDTMGTVIGVSARTGLIRNGRIERAERVFAADSIATIVGAAGGHSTVTSFVESTAGVEAGGRTGVAALVVGCCFLLSLFFYPAIYAVASCGPATAAALVIVGSLMLRCAAEVDWDDTSEAIPAFLIICGIPLSGSIVGGIALGLGIYPFIKLFSGRGREAGAFSYVTGVLLLIYLLVLVGK